MLYRYNEVFRTLLGAADLVVIASAWLGAYVLRFNSGLPVPLGVPPAIDYAYPLAVILPLFLS